MMVDVLAANAPAAGNKDGWRGSAWAHHYAGPPPGPRECRRDTASLEEPEYYPYVAGFLCHKKRFTH